MAKAERFILTEEMAKEAMNDIIHEIWSHYPKEVEIRLQAAVDEVPTIHVEYDTNVIIEYAGWRADK